MKVWKKTCKPLFLLALALACQQAAFGQAERSKVIKKDFAAKSAVSVSHHYGLLSVKKSTDGRIHLEAELTAKAAGEADWQALLERFDIAASEVGDVLDVDTQLGIESCNTVNGKTTIKFKDGKKISALRDVRANLTVFVPDLQRLHLKNKYDNIQIETALAGDLDVELYSGELSAGNVRGSFSLEIKYGKARLKSLGKSVLNLYDSELTAGDVAEAAVSSKYSEVVLGNVAGKLSLDTYDDTWKVGSVGGQLSLIDKYSELEFAAVEKGRLNLYDATFTAERVGELQVDESKYTKYKIGQVGVLKFKDSYDDEVRVQEVGILQAGRSKYTEYRAGKLVKIFGIGESYDDAVVLDEVAANFSGIGFDGKYTDLTMHIVEGGQFEVSADMQYGDFDYPEKLVNTKVYKEKDSNLLISGSVGGEKKIYDSYISIKGYDCRVVWR